MDIIYMDYTWEIKEETNEPLYLHLFFNRRS